MSLLAPSSSRPSFGQHVAGPALIVGAALVLLGAGLALGSQHAAPAGEACALPTGIRLADLDPGDAARIARRQLACSDLAHGRIAIDDYRAAIAAIDAAWTPAPAAAPRPAVVWASTVRGVSSEYTATSWSARQVLGPPDVYPSGGDNARAWASRAADAAEEWIEVGFDRAGAAQGIELYETFNPGAVDRVELITASGRRIPVQTAAARPTGELATRRTLTTRCTQEPVVAARVHLASAQVAGWNELDAIGLVPCP